MFLEHEEEKRRKLHMAAKQPQPDIHAVRRRKPILWISGNKNRSFAKNRVQISTPTAVECIFCGYPAAQSTFLTPKTACRA
jgi:hypothetical protein